MRCRRRLRWPPRWAVRPISNRRLTARTSSPKARASWARCRGRKSRCVRCCRLDLMIVLGADPLRMSVHSEVDPLPDGLPIVQIGLVEWDLAKNYGAEIALKADVKETLRALVPALKAAGGPVLEGRAKQGIGELPTENWSA